MSQDPLSKFERRESFEHIPSHRELSDKVLSKENKMSKVIKALVCTLIVLTGVLALSSINIGT